MTRRSGTLIYRLASLVAVLAIFGAVAWNVQTFQERQQAQENLRTFPTEQVEREKVLAEAFARQRASTQSLKRSLTFGGVLVLGGLIVFGLGLAARYASRTPNNNRDREGDD
jgi:hypothetical protein